MSHSAGAFDEDGAAVAQNAVACSAASDGKFELAVKLSRVLGDARLNSPETLREALRLGRHISLWDVVVTYLVLYRFPLLFLRDEGRAARQRELWYRLRPYRGLAARFRDFVMSYGSRSAKGCATWPESSRTVLFMCFTESFYRDVLRPVALSLAKRRLARVVVLHGGHLPRTQANDGEVIFHSIWDHWDNSTEQVERSLRQKLRGLKRELFGTGQFRTLIEVVRDQFGDINLTSEFYWLFWREFIRLALQVAVAEHILFRHRSALIISADDADQRCRVYSLLARAAGVPTLLVQQGFSFKDYPEWRFLSHGKVAAMGESSRAGMIAQGVDSDRIVVTGHPGFDNLIVAEPDVGASVRNDLGISEHQRMVLFASQPSYIGAFDQPHIRTEMIEMVARVVGSLKDVKLVIKPHPGERRKDLTSLIGTMRHVVITDGAVSIAPLIKACDVLITFFSQSALQALYAGKPVINIDIPGSGGSGLYTGSNATWVARSAEDLKTHITNLLSAQRAEHMKAKEEAKHRFLHDMVHHPDGKATDRVVQVVAELLGPERAEGR